MKKILMFFLVVLLIIVNTACENNESLNEETRNEVVNENSMENDIIRIGVMNGYEPYILLENGKVSGPYIDIVASALDILGYEYEFVPLPWSRLLNAVESGDVLFAFPMFDKSERRLLFDYSTEAIGFSQINLIGPNGSDLIYEGDFDSLGGYQIGVVLDYFYSSEFEQAVKDGIVSTEDAISSDTNIEKLLQGRVDFIIEDFTVFKEYERMNNLSDDLMVFDYPIISDANYIVYTKSKNLTQLREDIDKTLEAMKTDNTLYDIFNTYNMGYYGDAFRAYEVNKQQ